MSAITHKPLPETFQKNGYRYELVARTEHVALYGQCDADTEIFLAYEVCRILRHNGRVIAGNVVPPAEFLPSTEQWGQLAWTYTDERAAYARYCQQHERVQANTTEAL